MSTRPFLPSSDIISPYFLKVAMWGFADMPSEGKDSLSRNLEPRIRLVHLNTCAHERGMDAFEQMELQRQRESRQRIVDRFLRLILVGFLLDALKGDADGAKDERKKKSSSKSSGSEGLSVKSLKEKANTYGGPAIMLALAIRAAEEGSPRDPRVGLDLELSDPETRCRVMSS
eukprot:s2965_g10.t1